MGYNAAVGATYLATLDGTTASSYCETLNVANTGTFLATQGGYWEGQLNFEYSTASYSGSLTSYTMSYDEYVQMMKNLYVSVKTIGNYSTQYDLATNLLFWFSFSALPTMSNTVQRFNLIGDPSVVFDRQHITATFSNAQGDCNISNLASFDASRSMLSVDYNYHNFVSSPVCNHTASPTKNLGYIPGMRSDFFQTSVDVRSLVTCLSVSVGILDFLQMVEIASTRSTYSIDGVTYNTSEFYDPQYPGMTPLSCIETFDHKHQQCLLKINGLYTLPFFHHKGNNSDLPMGCICSSISAFDKQYAFAPCNRFEFLIGFLFFPETSSSADSLYDLVAKYNFNYTVINSLSYPASFTAGFWGQESPYYESVLNDPSARKKAYSFCELPATASHHALQSCSLLTFSTFDSTRHDWAISKYYYQLMFGACQDRISTSWENW